MWVHQEVCVHTCLRVHMLRLCVKSEWSGDVWDRLACGLATLRVPVPFSGRLRLSFCGWSSLQDPRSRLPHFGADSWAHALLVHISELGALC